MRTFLQKVPIPTSGLMLGLFSLAKLYASLQWHVASSVFFICGLLLFSLLVCKIAFAFSSVLHDLTNPIVASVAPTFTMGMMVMASMLLLHTPVAIGVWLIAIALQAVLIGYFVYRFIMKQIVALQDVYPSWFILFVGLGIAPVTTADVFPQLANVLFSFALVNYVVLLPIVCLRIVKHDLAEATKPLLTILAAPGSLCLTGYVQLFEQPNAFLLYALLIASQLLYVFVCFRLPKLLTLPFYPSYAAFTFPLVISATALFTTASILTSSFLHGLAMMELWIATAIVVYVLIRYIRYFVTMRKTQVRKYDVRTV